MPSPRSQRMLNIMRSNRRLFQSLSSQALDMITLSDEGVAELNIFGTKGRLLEGVGVPALLVVPRRVISEDVVLLHMHGGAYVSGNLLQARMVISPISAAAKLQGVTFAYRLLPEHRYPAQLDDALSVYRMLLNKGARPERIGLVGESAGGNLALALVQRLRSLGEPLPGALCLLSPWTDPAQTGKSYSTLREVDATLDAEEIMKSALAFVGGDAERFADPMISPIYADFTGFPPTQIHVGESEILFSDSETLAAHMRRDGVSVSFVRWAGMPHVFQVYGFDESRASIKAMGHFLSSTLAGGQQPRVRAGRPGDFTGA